MVAIAALLDSVLKLGKFEGTSDRGAGWLERKNLQKSGHKGHRPSASTSRFPKRLRGYYDTLHVVRSHSRCGRMAGEYDHGKAFRKTRGLARWDGALMSRFCKFASSTRAPIAFVPQIAELEHGYQEVQAIAHHSSRAQPTNRGDK